MKFGILNFLLLVIGLNCFAQSNQEIYDLPFLDINTSSRLGGFGEVGVVSSPFYKNTGAYQNPALISKHSRFAGLDINYMPKLNTIINDESIFSLSGFFALDSSNAFAINFPGKEPPVSIAMTISGW